MAVLADGALLAALADGALLAALADGALEGGALLADGAPLAALAGGAPFAALAGVAPFAALAARAGNGILRGTTTAAGGTSDWSAMAWGCLRVVSLLPWARKTDFHVFPRFEPRFEGLDPQIEGQTIYFHIFPRFSTHHGFLATCTAIKDWALCVMSSKPGPYLARSYVPPSVPQSRAHPSMQHAVNSGHHSAPLARCQERRSDHVPLQRPCRTSSRQDPSAGPCAQHAHTKGANARYVKLLLAIGSLQCSCQSR